MRARGAYFLVLSVAVAASFWAFDAYFDARHLPGTTLNGSLLHGGGHAAFRLIISMCFILFGAVAFRMFQGYAEMDEKRRQAIRQTYEESRKFELALESLGVGVVIQDLDYTILYENNIQQDILGNNVGLQCYEAYEGRDTVCTHCPMVRSLKDGGVHFAEVNYPVNGDRRHYELITSSLRDSGNEVWGGITLVSDITDMKKTEKELELARQGLEHEVMERTRELHDSNVSLQMEVVERKSAEEQIKASLVEKEVLLKEIHHRVKNNLQIITSLISLQESSGVGSEVSEVFSELKGRIRAMLLVHEKLYQEDNLASVDALDFISDIVGSQRSIMCMGNNVAVEVSGDSVSMDMSFLIPCGLLVNEIVSNAFKYAFPGDTGGRLYIKLAVSGRRRVLKISDNGVGIPDGIDPYKAGTLGFRIITAFVKQIGGSLELDRNGGTTYTIAFDDSIAKTNCWEFMDCGRHKGGASADELGVCPASVDNRLDGKHNGINAGRACWVIAGTLCRGRVQGTHAEKENDCVKCEFYQMVISEEADNLLLSSELLRVLKNGGSSHPLS